MQVWPAIDLRGGKCVRLRQGDYARETVFSDDPAAMARRFVEQGASHLHLVDLDGAKAGEVANLQSVKTIRDAIEIEIELGGGIRSETSIEQLLALGLDRLVIGTLALKQPDWFRQMCRRYPHRLALGIDARGGLVATDGWLETSCQPATELARQFAGEPIAAIIYTDIAADGMLQGPNFEALAQMCAAVDAPVVASGGVTTVADVEQLARSSVAGCIIGRAIYEGSLSLSDALRAAHPPDGVAERR